VNNADNLLKWSKKVLGSTIVNAIIKRTFFRHFCAGELFCGLAPELSPNGCGMAVASDDYCCASRRHSPMGHDTQPEVSPLYMSPLHVPCYCRQGKALELLVQGRRRRT
jgi:hypothetical protein